MASPDEGFRTLYVDPGEDTGWALAKGLLLLAAGTEKLWSFYDEVYGELGRQDGQHGIAGMLAEGRIADLRPGIEPAQNTGRIERIVFEDWRLYPWELRNMKWDPCRTARLIGGLTGLSRQFIVELVSQPAAIKSTAQKAGAEQLYLRPLHENRHANDAIQHFTYFTQTEMLGVKMIVPQEAAR